MVSKPTRKSNVAEGSGTNADTEGQGIGSGVYDGRTTQSSSGYQKPTSIFTHTQPLL